MRDINAQEQAAIQRQNQLQATITAEIERAEREQEEKKSKLARVEAIDLRITAIKSEDLRLNKGITELKAYMKGWQKFLNFRTSSLYAPYALPVQQHKLLSMENNTLSLYDLNRKEATLEELLKKYQTEQQTLMQEKQGLKDEIELLNNNAISIADDIQKVILDRFAAQYEQDGGDVWFARFNLIACQYLNEPNQEELNAEFINADRAMVISCKLEPANFIGLFSCWRMINHAKNVVTAELKKNNTNSELAVRKTKYSDLSKKTFTTLVAGLPLEMHLLKILLFVEDYDSIHSILSVYDQLLKAHNGNIPKAIYVQFIQGLSDVVAVVNRKHAQEHLVTLGINVATFPGANDLIAQQAYLQRLKAFLSFAEVADNAPLRAWFDVLTARFEGNINNCRLRNKAVNDAAQDMINIRRELERNNSELTRHLFFENFERRMWQTAPIAPIAGLLFHGVLTIPLVASVVGMAAAESASLQSSVEMQEAKQLANDLDPMDYLFINSADKVMGVHTGVAANSMHVTGDTAETAAKKRVVNEVDKLIDRVFDDKQKQQGYFSARISDKLLQKAQPKIVSAALAIVALYTITLTSALSSLIILTVVFPAIWPVALAAISASALVGLGVSQILAPGSTLPEKLIRVATNITFGMAATLHVLSAPMRSLRANAKEGWILATLGSLVGSVFGSAAIMIMMPLSIIPYFAAGILGFVGSIAPIVEQNGVKRRRTFREILNMIYVAPANSLRTMKDTELLANKDLFVLTAADAAYIDSVMPQIGNKKFSELFNAYISARLDAIQQRLEKVDASSLEQISAIANEAKHFESECNISQGYIKVLLINRSSDNAEVETAALLKHFTKHFDSFMKKWFESERQVYVETCSARKQQPAPQMVDVAKVKPVVMRFSSNDARVKAAEKLLGTPPQFEMEYAVNYEAERAQIERIIAMQQMVSKVRPN